MPNNARSRTRVEDHVSVTLAAKTASISLVIPRDQLPYDILVAPPEKQPDAEITIRTETGAFMSARLGGAGLRRKLVEAGRFPNAAVILTGRLARENRLTDAGLTVVKTTGF